MEQTWYLRKAADGSDYGPVTLQQLAEWAHGAQVSPLDRVSSDGKAWLKAPMVPELGMDYLIEVGTGEYYGPTTIGALKEFLRVGEIRMDMRITNCKDATEMLLQDLLTDEDDDTRNAANERYAYTGSIRLNLQQRIRELEALVMEERRGREAAEALANRLQERIAELEDRA